MSFGANNAQTLETPVIPMVTKVPAPESVMKANQAEFRTILRAAVPMVVGLALSYFATASFALGTAEQRIACTPDVFRPSLSQACRSGFDTPTSDKTASSK